MAWFPTTTKKKKKISTKLVQAPIEDNSISGRFFVNTVKAIEKGSELKIENKDLVIVEETTNIDNAEDSKPIIESKEEDTLESFIETTTKVIADVSFDKVVEATQDVINSNELTNESVDLALPEDSQILCDDENESEEECKEEIIINDFHEEIIHEEIEKVCSEPIEEEVIEQNDTEVFEESIKETQEPLVIIHEDGSSEEIVTLSTEELNVMLEKLKDNINNLTSINIESILPLNITAEKYKQLAKKPYELRYKGVIIFDSFKHKKPITFGNEYVMVGDRKYPYQNLVITNK